MRYFCLAVALVLSLALSGPAQAAPAEPTRKGPPKILH